MLPIKFGLTSAQLIQLVVMSVQDQKEGKKKSGDLFNE